MTSLAYRTLAYKNILRVCNTIKKHNLLHFIEEYLEYIVKIRQWMWGNTSSAL